MEKQIIIERDKLFEPNVYIAMVVSFETVIPQHVIHNAVARAYMAHETTMSKIVMTEDGKVYYEKLNNSGCGIYFDNRDWQTIAKESEKRAFALPEGEMMRTFVMERDGGTQVLFHAHHLVGDGKALLIFIQDVLKVLEGKSLEYHPAKLIDKEFLNSRAQFPQGLGLVLKLDANRWKRTGRVFTWDDYYDLHDRYWSEHTSEFLEERFSVSEIKKQCQYGQTVNSYLITELLRRNPNCSTLGFPVSIRENNSMTNQISGLAVQYQYDAGISFQENVSNVQKDITKQLADRRQKYYALLFEEQMPPTLIDSVLMQYCGCYHNSVSKKMCELMGYTGKGKKQLGLSNLNQFEISNENRSYKMKDILFVPPRISYIMEIFGVISYEDTLHMVHHRMHHTKG